jgi:hypothetical protein
MSPEISFFHLFDLPANSGEVFLIQMRPVLRRQGVQNSRKSLVFFGYVRGIRGDRFALEGRLPQRHPTYHTRIPCWPNGVEATSRTMVGT